MLGIYLSGFYQVFEYILRTGKLKYTLLCISLVEEIANWTVPKNDVNWIQLKI